MKETMFSYQVELGDNTTYSIQGVGSTSILLNSENLIHVDEILYVFGLKKNILSIVGLSSCIGRAVHPHVGTIVCSLFSRSFSSMDFVDGAVVYLPHRLIHGLLWSPLCYSVFCWGFLYVWGREFVHFHAQKSTLFDLT